MKRRRNVSATLARAFQAEFSWLQKRNTLVYTTVPADGAAVTAMELYRHEIALHYRGKLRMTLCGHNTRLTRGRLNAILAEFFPGTNNQYLRFTQRNFGAMFAGVEISANDVIEIDTTTKNWRVAGSILA